MSKNIKIGNKTFNGVEYISCECADEPGVQRLFKDASSGNKLITVIDGRTPYELTAEDLAGLTYICSNAFYYHTSLTSITIPNSVTHIGGSAFYYCMNLTSVTIPNSVIEIGIGAFMFTKLTSITIPGSMTKIQENAFSNCSKLANVTIPNSVTRIENSAFRSCDSLTSITIPDSVTYIGGSALQFGSETNKATITFLSATPPTVFSTTFNTAKLNKIIVPAGCGDAYKAATNWSAYADYIEEAAAA